jgi:hypothetical protein
VGQNIRNADILGTAAVPCVENIVQNLGQSMSVLEIIKIRRLKETIGTDAVENCRYSFNERAAILEFDAGYDRDDAERMAMDEYAEAMMHQYPELSANMTKIAAAFFLS